MIDQSAKPQGRRALGHSLEADAQAGDRDLVVITGTHKTGSTALHRYLRDNHQNLALHGIRYEIAGFEGDFGNAQSLFDLLFQQQVHSAELDKQIEEYLALSKTAICLSEDLTRLGSKEWKLLSAAFQRLRIRPRFLTYVRNVCSYYSSVHSETAKAGLTSMSFAEFCASNHYSYVIRSLQSI